MQNVKMTLKGNILVLEVDLSKTQGPSASGKTEIIATSQGNQPVAGRPDVKVGLNVYTSRKAAA